MNNKKLSKVTKIATASFLIAGTTAFTAFAAMPQGTVVIGDKAFDINYANIPEHVDEISKAVVESKGKVFVKGFDGKWVNNATGANVEDLSVIPAVEYKGKDGKVVKYQAKDGDVVTAGELTVSAVNSKTLEAKFNQPVDTAKAKIEVKKGSITSNVSKITWSDDKTTAKIELASKLFEGEYTVNVSGLSEKPMSAKVKVENEKVAQIDILSENAVLNQEKNSASVGYKVLNQYGEDITSKTSLTATSSNGTKSSAEGANSIVKITDLREPKVGDKISLTLVHGETATVTTKLLTISEGSKVDKVDITGLYNADKKVLSEDTKANDFYLLVDAKDQYGNSMKKEDLNKENSVLVTSSNPTVVKPIDKSEKFSEITIDGKKVTALKLDTSEVKAGKTEVSIISLSTGKLSKFEVEVKEGVYANTIALSQPELAVAGEKVTIPFEAYDKEGNKIANKDVLSKIDVKVSGTGVSERQAKFEKDATGKINLVADLTDVSVEVKEKGTKVTVIAKTPAPSYKFATMFMDVKAEAKPAYIASIKDIPTNVEAGQDLTIALKNLVVKDQYEREFKLKNKLGDKEVGKYQIEVAALSSQDVLTCTSNIIKDDDDKIILHGKKDAKGSENIKLTINKVEKEKETIVAKPIAGSELEFTVRVAKASEYTSYEVKDIDTIYDDSEVDNEKSEKNKYSKKIEVYGVLANGQKVILPATSYSVATGTKGIKVQEIKEDDKITEFKLNVQGDKEGKSTVEYAKDAKEAKGKAVVTINAKGEQITKEFTISKVAPKVASVELKKVEKGIADINMDATKKIGSVAIFGLVGVNENDKEVQYKAKDQYGEKVTISNTDGKITFEDGSDSKSTALVSEYAAKDKDTEKGVEITGNGTETISIAGVNKEDTFKLTFDFGGYKVPVKANVKAQ